MKELQERAERGEELSIVESDELAQLKKQYHDFLADGMGRLQAGGGLDDKGQQPHTDDFVAAIDNVRQSVAVVGKAAYFWGSLFATVVPGYFGRKLGVTTGFLHWSFITDRLILGALPVVTQVGSSGNHLAQLREQLKSRNQQLGLVIACLEDIEIQGFGVEIVRFADEPCWHHHMGSTVAYISLPIVDTTAEISFEDVANTVKEMDLCISQRQCAVYVHCKAGKGRSWMLVMCYLTTYGKMTFGQAETLIRDMRPQINPSPSQQAFASQFASRFHMAQE
ncbi:dual specificity phosphatase [Trypanosoma grayi]|uniref:dual specificity phosphatase n=1 Tax=Trypanosoma grayi TaxID=71804 RepID=UPI0004F4A068|nr:dual specificity phosphatase [Trypanosoma grayi]KEG13413.1 dual specificity phosphatase [Trypanosoma grayi]